MASNEEEACTLVTQACQRGDFAGAVAVMRAHAGSARVQARCCRALDRKLKADANPITAAAAAAGALDAVSVALKAFPADVATQSHGCRALAKLTMHNTSSKQEAAGLGAIATVMAALHAHATNAVVQQAACGAIYGLALQSPAN